MNNNTNYIKERTFTLRQSNDYEIPSKGLIISWTLIPKSNKQREKLLKHLPKIHIQTINESLPFVCGQSEENKLTFSFTKFRHKMKNLDADEIETNNQLLNIDRIFFLEQIDAMHQYKHLKSDDFFNSVYTYKMTINLNWINRLHDKLGDVEIKEVYYEPYHKIKSNS